MLKGTILRQARLCRLPTTSTLVAASRTATRPAQQSWMLSNRRCIVPTASSRQLSGRGYSTAAAEDHASDAPISSEAAPITKFADLQSLGVHDHLIRNLTQRMRYDTMTEVQSRTITPGLSGKDLVAQAKTGTGKTLAFLIPVVQRIIADDSSLAWPTRTRARADDIRAIVISPTRELAEQIGVEARKLCEKTGIKVQTAVGGTQKGAMLSRTRREGCHLLIATPGRLADILGDERSGVDAPKLSALVLDEADRMLDVGFEAELDQILRYLPNRSIIPRQTMLFSATIPKNVINLARKYVDPGNFEFVQTIAADETPTHEKVPQYIVPTRGYVNIYPTLLELMQRDAKRAKEDPTAPPFKAIVFFPTTSMVELVKSAFDQLRYNDQSLPPIYHIHSKLTQARRTFAAEDFRRARSGVLLSSDVTARGMDFPNVSHVIQIGVPPDREQYIHRIGRTGRAGKGGQGWLIVANDEIDHARRTLPDIPIQRAQGLESSTFDHSARSSDPPAAVEQFKAAWSRVNPELLRDAYLSHFGQNSSGTSMERRVANLNEWVREGWGWEQPPAISEHVAKKRGLLRVRGLNIASGRRENSWDSDGDNYGWDSGRRESRGQGRRSFNSDPFASMESGGNNSYRRPPRRASF